jgi:hypothetical protein
VYQLGIKSVPFTGQILMTAGLPVKFYSLDDSVMFLLEATTSRGSSMGHSASSQFFNALHKVCSEMS